MNKFRASSNNAGAASWSNDCNAFSLIELLAVLAILAILTAAALPALSFLKGRDFDGQITKITSLINLAHQAAVTRSTYTWILFYYTSAAQGPQLTLLAIDSKDGSDPINWGTYPNPIPDGTLELLAPPLTLSQIQLGGANTFGTFDAKIPSLTSSAIYPDNDVNNAIRIQATIPALGSVTFPKAIRFLPSNSASNGNSNGKFIELDLQPVQGAVSNINSVPTGNNLVVIRIDKASGSVEVFRP